VVVLCGRLPALSYTTNVDATIEIDRRWYAFPVAKRRFRKGWALSQGPRDLERTLRQFLDRQLT
jgi:hypothetical protein